jgi:AcrR family transcriptional regulator
MAAARRPVLRTDARRNRDRLLDAAVDLLLELGSEPPFDSVARRAGLGAGTLYRHFPDRTHLLEAVAHRVLDQSAEAAEAALAAGSDGHDALRRYMHAAVEHGVGVLNLIRPLLHDPDWSAQRSRMATLLQTILDRGTSDGSLRADVEPVDVVFATIRFSRPVAIGLSREDERAMAHRHLDIYIDGLGRLR